jgi:hypothetical protein
MAWWTAALDERLKVTVDICCLTDFQALIANHNLSGHGVYYFVPSLLKHFTTSEINALIVPRPHLALAGLLAWLAWSAFHGEAGYVPLLSEIDLAVHEFGHMLFMPFGIPILGSTMVILGGSLTQVAFPLLFFGYFLGKRDDGQRRDVFAAMACLWWSAINLLDVAIYCADSRAGELMLLDGLTGKESDGHDWNNLLTSWGLLDQDTAIARWMRAIAALVCIACIAVALWSELQPTRVKPAEVLES